MAHTHVFRQLMEDHRNLKKVLSVLEQEVAMYETETGDPESEPNLNLVLEIMDYVHYYPEFFHHPLEEAAFDYLVAKQLGDADKIEAVRREHKELEKISADLRDTINGISVGNPTPLTELREAIDFFVEAQRRHIRKEETTVFKTIKTLSQADCETIMAEVDARKDPVFAGNTESEYRELLHAISD